MANNNIVQFVLDDEVLAAVGEMDETGAHDLLNAACEWYIRHKTPMTLNDFEVTNNETALA